MITPAEVTEADLKALESQPVCLCLSILIVNSNGDQETIAQCQEWSLLLMKVDLSKTEEKL